MVRFDRLVAQWTVHERKGDPQRRPLVLEHLNHAVHVEDVATLEKDRWLLMQLTSVADVAQLLLAWELGAFDALWLQAGQTLFLVLDAAAIVATLLFFPAEGQATSEEPLHLGVVDLFVVFLFFSPSQTLLVKVEAELAERDFSIDKCLLDLLFSRV